jgi:hypothetical protein
VDCPPAVASICGRAGEPGRETSALYALTDI